MYVMCRLLSGFVVGVVLVFGFGMVLLGCIDVGVIVYIGSDRCSVMLVLLCLCMM